MEGPSQITLTVCNDCDFLKDESSTTDDLTFFSCGKLNTFIMAINDECHINTPWWCPFKG